LKLLKQKVLSSLKQAVKVNDFERIAAEAAEEMRACVTNIRDLRQRTISSSWESEEGSREKQDMRMAQREMASEMDSACTEIERSAAQLWTIKERALRGLLGAIRSGELAQIAATMGDIADHIETRCATLEGTRKKARESLLEAHRSGELSKLADELLELTDIPAPLPPLGSSGAFLSPFAVQSPIRGSPMSTPGGTPREAQPPVPVGEGRPQPKAQPKRWADFSSDSDREAQIGHRRDPPDSETDPDGCSQSEAEGQEGGVSAPPWRVAGAGRGSVFAPGRRPTPSSSLTVPKASVAQQGIPPWRARMQGVA